jgi:hypothetical protein
VIDLQAISRLLAVEIDPQVYPDFASILRALRPTRTLIGLFVAAVSALAIDRIEMHSRWRPRTDRAPGDDHVEEANLLPWP